MNSVFSFPYSSRQLTGNAALTWYKGLYIVSLKGKWP